MEGKQARTGQIKATPNPKPSLTCSIVRFLKGPLIVDVRSPVDRSIIHPRVGLCEPARDVVEPLCVCNSPVRVVGIKS
jgi:hypothetical protein